MREVQTANRVGWVKLLDIISAGIDNRVKCPFFVWTVSDGRE